MNIYNVLGEEILKQVQNDKSVTIDVSGFAKGVYIVEITAEGSFGVSTGSTTKVTRKKFVKE